LHRAIVGRRRGLSVMLDHHTDQTTFGTLMSDTSGFNVFVGEPEEFPMLQQRSQIISPGQEHHVELSAFSVSSDDDVRNLPVADRKCLFREEGFLTWHAQYSHTTCVFECKLQAAEVVLGCLPWYMPQGPNSTVCDPWTARTFSGQMEVMEETGCDCLPDCQAAVYSYTHSLAPFR
jgi:hypothetical protein